tara:strand:+ start:265 stop:849 length:585 start_codon:yes stop_codon:yes gene_type:complete
MNSEKLQAYKIDLIQTGYMAEYWDGKKSDFACTVYGMDRLLVWMQITDEVKNIDFQANAPLITTDKKNVILTEFIGEKFVTRIFKNGQEERVPTEKGVKWFEALLFLQDDDAKKKQANIETAKKVGFGFMKGLVKFTMELQKMSMKMNQAQDVPKTVKKKSTKKKVKKKSEKKKMPKDEKKNQFGFKTITSEDL